MAKRRTYNNTYETAAESFAEGRIGQKGARQRGWQILDD
jgi:hypothetical protein